jgi:hypothetical protein
MKKLWLGTNILWSILFVVTVGYTLFRKSEAADTIQTVELQMISFILLFIFFLFIFLCQFTWGLSLRNKQKR